jgi:hypothetical protein
VLPNPPVGSIPVEQLAVAAAFDRTAVLEHDDFVHSFHADQAMGDRQDRPALHVCVDGLQDLGFGDRIQISDSFIQDQEGWIFQQGACDSKTLALTSAEVASALSDPGVESIR